MKKKFLSLALALTLCSGTVTAFGFDINVTLNSNSVTFADQEPVIKDGRTLVPLRGVLEEMGVKVTYIDEIKTVSMEKGSTGASVKIGDDTLTVNSQETKLDVAPEIINDRTMVPIRAIAEAFGATVGWNDETKTVEITMPAEEASLEKGDVKLEAGDAAFYSKATELWSLKSADGVELLNVTLVYPSLNGRTVMDGNINAYMAESAQTMADKYIEQNKAVLEDEAQKLGKDFRTNSIYVSFEDIYQNETDGILSYLTTFMVDTAGAHPVTYGYGTTIDMENGAEVSVSEIANADGESAITDVQRAVNYLRDEIAENPDKYLEGAAKYLDENTAGNYGCYFGKDKLIIFAAAGSIAPYSSGMLKFEVPLK